MSRIDVSWAAKVLGGRVERPDRIRVPGPNDKKRGRNDDSLMVFFGDDRPEGYEVYSHSGDDWRVCRDYVRDRLGLPAWKPDGKPRAVFVADQFIYEQADGFPYHRIDLMSDGTYRHFWFEADGWDEKHPPMFIPFALPDLQSDETVWLVRGEDNARLIRDGFNQVATTYPSGVEAHADASFLYHLAGKDIRILNVGGAESRKFCALFSEAMGLPVWSLPEGVSTLRALARTEGGSLDQCVSGDEFEPVPSYVEGDQAETDFDLIPTPFEWCDPSSIPPREWVYDTHLIRKFVSLTVSPGGLGKSSLALVEALSLVIGRPLLADARIHEGPLRVWYWNGEDPQEETKRRVMAAAKHYGLSASDLGGRLFTDSGRDTPLVLGQNDREGITLNEALFEKIEQTMISHSIDVFIADPFVSAHRLGENDNNAIDALIKRLGRVADKTNSAIEIVHHVRKPNASQTETDVNDARGASALIGGVRSARVLNVMSEEVAQAAGVSSDIRLRHFSVSDGKANMSPKAGEARWRFLESVNLENKTEERESDNVGVVTYYELPKEAKQTHDLSRAEDEMRLILSTDDTVRHWDGKGRGRKPKNWLGHRILDALQIHGGEHDAAMQRLITGWIKEGTIVTRAAWTDGNRHTFLTLPGASFQGSPVICDTDDDDPF